MSRSRLTYRIAEDQDLAYLITLREECGWGIPKLKKEWDNPDYLFCVLELAQNSAGSTGDEEKEVEQITDVGMACWVLQHEDPDMASRSTKTVYLCRSPADHGS